MVNCPQPVDADYCTSDANDNLENTDARHWSQSPNTISINAISKSGCPRANSVRMLCRHQGNGCKWGGNGPTALGITLALSLGREVVLADVAPFKICPLFGGFFIGIVPVLDPCRVASAEV